MPRPRRTQRLVRLRHHALTRLSAITFIVLILLPFTAPFPTYHVDQARSHPFEALPKEFKNKLDSDDGVVLPADCRLLLPAWSAVSVRDSLCVNQLADPPIHHTVLRV